MVSRRIVLGAVIVFVAAWTVALIYSVTAGGRSPERLDNPTALAVFASDALSSVAYATEEILRVLDSLQLTANYKVATPVNWKHGEDCIIVPALSDADADKLFPKGYKKIKPYLRTTKQPNL